jgi:PAS domain S-box-containing protein
MAKSRKNRKRIRKAVAKARPRTGSAKALQESEGRFHLVVEAAPNAMLMVNREGMITLVNAQVEKVFGYARQELIGQPIEILVPERFRASHPGYRKGFFADPQTRAMGAGRDLFGRRKDGSEVPIEIGLNPLTTAEGSFVLASIIDITERKRAEDEINKLNAELEQRVLERTAQLHAANQTKDRFLASMSHELRTPLNAVIGFTGTLLMKLPGPLTTDQETQLKTIQNSARHLLSLINDLLDLAKIESGKVEVNLEPVVCQDVIEEVVGTLRPAAESKNLRVEIKGPREQVRILSDRRSLSQILINLINNAIKFTEQGGVRVELGRRSEGGKALTEISVIDTGIGIGPEDQAKLFDAFTQASNHNGRRQDGTGLGLHLSQKLATLVGGRIDFQSELGRGSRFRLIISEK